MHTAMVRAGLPILGALALGLITGCSSVNEVTRERVARSETAVQQAQQTVGTAESGAVELQRAKDNLDQARRALNDKDAKMTERYAQQAQLGAELAVAKSQTASARKAADELMASIQTLRQEAARFAGHRITLPLAAYSRGTMMARRSAFEAVGGFDPRMGHGEVQDWVLRAREAGLRVDLLPDTLLERRLHPGNRSRHMQENSREEFLQLIKRRLDLTRGR